MLTAFFLSLALCQGYAPLRATTEPLDARDEMRVQRLGKQLRCAVCQGVSIADSPASMARAQLDKVRKLVAAGKTDDEVYDFFVERYGEWVLLEPKKSGVTIGLWLFPMLVFFVGLLAVWRSFKRQTDMPQDTCHPTDDYLAKVRADIE